MFNFLQEFYLKYCIDKHKHQTKLTFLNLFSNLISRENLSIETGIQEQHSNISILYKNIIQDEGAHYYYFTYEDFIVIFSRIITYYLGNDINIQFTEQINWFMLSIHGQMNRERNSHR